MEKIVLNPIKIAYEINEMEVFKDFHTDSKTYKTIIEIIENTGEMIKSRAILKWCNVEKVEQGCVTLMGQTFVSKLLFDKLRQTEKVFINIVTAGDELDAVKGKYPASVVDILKYAILMETRNEVKKYVSEIFGYKDIAELCPGSLPDWPVENNRILFEIINNVGEIGVTLKKDCFMTPLNTVSGILYHGDKDYINCNLCEKISCIGRKKPFNKIEYLRIFS
ncbi:hypothetical protein [Acetobacterium bakii]|uniref:AdoMet activation domain-containing protein n=1 Tax=Acetobacterium bakii TaxID=52689 RepID=A0A0L6TY80_9FIRM|nr:hypothetical protein [Acetobacterium bakii]KNZ41032.1 hypothetical protein AKG39_14450 [Acetobacterium bakii]